MKIISLILARGGSKGIPNKNIINLNGSPLIQYTITASQQSKVHETWVSTDCQKIKQISEKLGAHVIDRPETLAQDTSPSEDAILHFCKIITWAWPRFLRFPCQLWPVFLGIFFVFLNVLAKLWFIFSAVQIKFDLTSTCHPWFSTSRTKS